MSLRTLLTLLWLGVLAASCGSVAEDEIFSSKDGAFYTEDAVILNGKQISKILLQIKESKHRNIRKKLFKNY